MSASPSTSPVGRFAQSAAVLLTLAVFGAAVAFVTFRLRDGLRQQILLTQAETLSAVASLQLAITAQDEGTADAPGALLNAVLKVSKFRGVIALRAFDAEGRFLGAAPLGLADDAPGADWNGEISARLQHREKLQVLSADPDFPSGDFGVPLVEAWVPVRRPDRAQLAGVVQFWIGSEDAAADFSALDRRLLAQALVAWAAGAAIIVVTMGWAFRRLAEANRALQQRTEDLERANRELALAAKTSALGAVTAHLIHEIKNPLAGLEIFVAGQAEPGTREENSGELVAARELTKRLRTMVNDVVGVLRDEQHGAHFDLTPAEIAEMAIGRVRPAANIAGVRLVADVKTEKPVEGRRANLAGLVLRNLLQNAIEASPPASVVTVMARLSNEGGVEFLVEDRGAGLPQAVRERLFQPCTSSKPGGSGLGLALSQQLAQQAGGRIELARSDTAGTCFRLHLSPAD